MRRALFLLFVVLGGGAFVGACAQAAVIGDDMPGDDGGLPDTAPCTSMCSGMCVDTKTDNSNCGKCGNACPMNATCVQGSCQCGMGQVRCGNNCVDTKTDLQNCGKCGNICGNDAGAIPGGGMYGCNMGACGIICPMGKTECSGSCIDTMSDIDNCGMCGNACDPNMMQTCTSGLCCTMGQSNCSGMCVDTQFDAKNCGMCGKACPMNTPYCNKGMCTQCDNTVLLLGDGNSATNMAFVNKANAAGLSVTYVNGGVTTYSGNPAASNFSVTVLMVGDGYSTDMPMAGQQSIVSAQGSGRGVVTTDWGGYQVYSSRWQTLKTINLSTYTTGSTGLLKFTLTQNGHPIWTNLPSTFTGTVNQGCQVGTLTNSGTQIAAINSPCSGPGVVVRSSPGGRMVYLAHAAGYSSATGWVNDTNMVTMTINAIKWATGCLL